VLTNTRTARGDIAERGGRQQHGEAARPPEHHPGRRGTEHARDDDERRGRDLPAAGRAVTLIWIKRI
jgi:hypothetical protein